MYAFTVLCFFFPFVVVVVVVGFILAFFVTVLTLIYALIVLVPF